MKHWLLKHAASLGLTVDGDLSVDALRAQITEAVAAGVARVKEGERSLDDIRRAVDDAVRRQYADTGLNSTYVYACEVYPDHVIINKGDKYYSVAYSIAKDGTVTFTGEPAEVEQAYQPVKESAAHANGPSTALPTVTRLDGSPYAIGLVREASGAVTGKQWNVLIIQEGLSQNRVFYSRQVLESAAPLYERARIFVGHNASAAQRSPKDVAGFVKDITPVMVAQEGESEGRFALAATAVVTSRAVREQMLDAWEASGAMPLWGLSHDAGVKDPKTFIAPDGRAAIGMTAITKVNSVDFVTNPAAGGRVVRLAASVESPIPNLSEDGRMLEKLLARLRALDANAVESLGPNPTEDRVLEALDAAFLKANAKSDAAPPKTAETKVQEEKTSSLSDDDRRLLEETRSANARLNVKLALGECSLPDSIKKRIQTRFEARITEGKNIPTEGEIVSTIREHVEDWSQALDGLVQQPHVVMNDGKSVRVQVTKDRTENVKEALNDFFAEKKGGPISFKELYIQITGDKHFTGQADKAILRESIGSGTFDQALGDSITRRMLDVYQMPAFARWQRICNVVPVTDFRTQRRIRYGGYANLPVVGQGAPYAALTSPTDEEATYSPAKRGGTESVTLEAIRNDDVGVIRSIPQRLGRAAAQTLYEFVLDLLRTNPTIYDSVALIAGGHNNNSTSALASSVISALRLKMKAQTDMSNGKRLGLVPRILWVPNDLEELAYQITGADKAVPDSALAAQAAPAAPNFIRDRVRLDVEVVDYWTDTNDWFLTATPDQTPMIEVGFLDGQQDPSIFVQDMPNVGSMFSNDSLTWKLRHVYGAAVVDYRGFAGSIVP